MNFSLYIAKRYLFSKSSNNAINIMTGIASGGVIVASAALFIVLSVFAGLKDFSLQFSSLIDPDLKLLPTEGKSFLWTNADASKVLQIEGVAVHSKLIEERIIIKSEGKNILVTLKAVDSNYTRVTDIKSMLTKGNWLTPNSNEVVAGWGVSNSLSFGVFDYLKPLSLYVPKPGKGQPNSIRGLYNSEYVNNVGLFDINPDLNSTYVFADLSLAKALLNYSDSQTSAIELKLQPDYDEGLIRAQLQAAFSNRFVIKNRAELNDALFKMLNTENLAIYLIFTLVIIIALFNVIGAIIMMILDKKTSLNTLFKLGTETKAIKNIFFLQGSLMTILSGFVGVIIGLLVVYIQQIFNLIMLTSEYPYPVRIKIFNVFIVLITITTLGVMASKIASQRISKHLVETSK